MPEIRWTAKAVADRLEEAAQTLRRLPPVTVRGYISAWPPIIRDFSEAYGWHEAENEVRLAWLRAEGVRWKSIAHRFGVDRSTAWRHWTCALIKIAAHLNGMSATKTSQQKTLRQEQPDFAH